MCNVEGPPLRLRAPQPLAATEPLPIYLDYNATTPLCEEAWQAMAAVRHCWGNASSLYPYGLAAKHALEQARGVVAAALHARAASCITFTSCGTEANNLALRGGAAAVRARWPSRRHIVTTSVEHPAVAEVVKVMAAQGRRHGRRHARNDGDDDEKDSKHATTTTHASDDNNEDDDDDDGFVCHIVDVDATTGRLEADALARVLTALPGGPASVALVSVMHANNELGTVQPIAQLARVTHALCGRDCLFHCDAAQSVGKVAVDVQHLDVDLLTVVPHKFYGPKGVAALYVRPGTAPLQRILHGAGHERGLRPGTESVLLTSGMAAALRVAVDGLEVYAAHMRATRDELARVLRAELRAHGLDFVVNGCSGRVGDDEEMCTNSNSNSSAAFASCVLPNTLNCAIYRRTQGNTKSGNNDDDESSNNNADAARAYISAPRLILTVGDRVCVSAGSACHSVVGDDEVTVSAPLRAVGVSLPRAIGTLRLSTGRTTTMSEARRAARILARAAAQQFADNKDATTTQRRGRSVSDASDDDDACVTPPQQQPCSWHGVPYTRQAGWLLMRASHKHNDDDDDKAALPSLRGVQLCVDGVDMVVDVYRTHMRCCWPRLLLDTCMAEAANAAAAAAAAVTTSVDARVRSRAALYVRQLHAQQRDCVVRAVRPRRAIYHNQLAPVLRSSSSGSGSADGDEDDIVNVITGTLSLMRHLPCNNNKKSNNNDSSSIEVASANDDTDDAAVCARDAFPLWLVMQPRGRCAAHLRPDPLPPPRHTSPAAAATRATAAATAHDDGDVSCRRDCVSQLLLLQDVQRCGENDDEGTHAQHATASSAAMSQPLVQWRATYAAFAWLLTLHDNSNMSRSVRRRWRHSRDAAVHTPHALCSSSTHTSTTATRPLQPLRLVFDVYAAQHRTRAARDAAVARLVHLAAAATTTTAPHADAVTTASDDDETEATSSSSSRLLLRHEQRYALFAHTTAAADVLDDAPHARRHARQRQRRLRHAQQQQQQRQQSYASPSSSTHATDDDSDDDNNNDDARLVYMGRLCSATTLSCECCSEASATYLGAVLPHTIQWPLRVAATRLTRASTLDELAEALAQPP